MLGFAPIVSGVTFHPQGEEISRAKTSSYYTRGVDNRASRRRRCRIGTGICGAAANPSGGSTGTFEKTVAGSDLPDAVKTLAANPTMGPVYILWPTGDGNFYFAINTTSGPVWFVIKTGTPTADAMLKVLFYAYDKRESLSVSPDPANPKSPLGIAMVAP